MDTTYLVVVALVAVLDAGSVLHTAELIRTAKRLTAQLIAAVRAVHAAITHNKPSHTLTLPTKQH